MTPHTSTVERRSRFQRKKLDVLIYIKDSLERRLAAVNASICKLEEQIMIHDQNSKS